MNGPLISAAALAESLTVDRGPAILDVRYRLVVADRTTSAAPSARQEYDAGHIPGAVFVDLDQELSDPVREGGRHPLPAPDSFENAMRTKGVCSNRPVVVYDAGGALAAARAWWLLRYYGHPQVAVLDGGLAAWQAAGLPLSTDTPSPEPGDFEPTPGHMPLVDADGAAELARTGILLDARAAERFRGEVEPIDPIAGHIPGARNHPTAENLDTGGCFRAPDQLRVAFKIPAGTPVGAYCGSGVTAAQVVLALELAGHEAALYAGSWSEWIADPSRPVATGSE